MLHANTAAELRVQHRRLAAHGAADRRRRRAHGCGGGAGGAGQGVHGGVHCGAGGEHGEQPLVPLRPRRLVPRPVNAQISPPTPPTPRSHPLPSEPSNPATVAWTVTSSASFLRLLPCILAFHCKCHVVRPARRRPARPGPGGHSRPSSDSRLVFWRAGASSTSSSVSFGTMTDARTNALANALTDASASTHAHKHS